MAQMEREFIFTQIKEMKFHLSSSAAQTFVRPLGLSVHDALGREVATLVNQQLSPGTYEIVWNASNYPSGLYFYKLSSGNFTETKRMILIK
jgi:hypothetical protein